MLINVCVLITDCTLYKSLNHLEPLTTCNIFSSNLSMFVYGNKSAEPDWMDKTCWKGLNLWGVPCQDWYSVISKGTSAAAQKCSFAFHRWFRKKFQTLSPYTLIYLALIYSGIVDLLLVRAWCLEGLILYRKQTFGGVTYCVQLSTFTKSRPGIFLPALFRENQACLPA